jgi:site-specific DNA recombinase
VKHAESLGYEVGRMTREVYTGAELWDRPKLASDRADLKAGRFQALVAYSTDRLSRDPIHLAIIADECNRSGVELVFVTEPLEASPEGALIRYVKGYAAQMEREKIRERSLRGRKARVLNGKIHGAGRELFGYTRDKEAGKRLVNAEEAAIVRLIFQQFVGERMALREIAQRFNDEGLASPSLRKVVYPDADHIPAWGKSTIRRILKDPAYKGETIAWRWKQIAKSGKCELRPEEENIHLPKGTTPALVSKDQWDKAQELLSRNKGGASRMVDDPFLLRRLVICSVCGRSMRAEREHGLRVYRCSSRETHTGPCGSSRVSAENTIPIYSTLRDAAGRVLKPDEETRKVLATEQGVEEWVWEQIASLLRDPATIENELKRRRDEGSDAVLQSDLAAATKSLAKVKRQQERLVTLYAASDDDFPLDLVKEQIKSAVQEAERWEATISDLEARLAQGQLRIEQLGALQEYCERVAQNLETFGIEEKRLALKALGITVKANGRDWRLDGEVSLADVSQQSSQSAGIKYAAPVTGWAFSFCSEAASAL